MYLVVQTTKVSGVQAAQASSQQSTMLLPLSLFSFLKSVVLSKSPSVMFFVESLLD